MTETISLDDIDFSRFIKAGDVVCWGQAGAEPDTLVSRLLSQRERIGSFRAFVGIGWADHPSACCDFVSFSSYCGTGTNRELVLSGDLDILPVHYSRLSRSLLADVVIIQLAPGLKGEGFSHGIACDYLSDLSVGARTVIAEVNELGPTTFAVHDARLPKVDVVVPTRRRPLAAPAAKSSPLDRRIAENVAAVVEDGATLQIGLGSLPDAIQTALSGHRNLGIHSGLITDITGQLIQSGCVTNDRKGRDKGFSVTGMLCGGPGLHALCSGNPAVRLAPTSYTHDPGILSSLNKFTAINSAIEVDLTGQVNAEFAGGRYVGAVGGAADFLRGAAASPGGLPIVALPSVLDRGQLGMTSRIVPWLEGPVTVSRADAGLIVTEHGIADLRGASVTERIEKMLRIAHPDFHESLARDARGILRRARQ